MSKWEFDISSIQELTNYIEVGFITHKWKIFFHDRGDKFVFDDGWRKFCRDCNINVGDICCFKSVKCVNSFQVVVYHLKDIVQWKHVKGMFCYIDYFRTFFKNIYFIIVETLIVSITD